MGKQAAWLINDNLERLHDRSKGLREYTKPLLKDASLEEVLGHCLASVATLEATRKSTRSRPDIACKLRELSVQSDDAAVTASGIIWEPNTSHCRICGSTLGKRYFRPRAS